MTAKLAAATDRMDRVLEGLKAASPEALDGCAALMELACQEVAGGFREPGGLRGAAGAETGVLAAALQLRARIQHARRLLDNLNRFHSHWDQLLGAWTGGYLPGGQAAPVRSVNHLCLRG
jgi:hypothetical protein